MSIKFAHFLKLTLALVLFLQVGEVSALTIPATNTTATGATKVPTGWVMLIESTDISDKTGFGGLNYYPWEGTVNNPPNGHSIWVGGFKFETAGTTISGLTIGNSYSFTFYIADLQQTTGGTIDTTYDGVFEVGSYTGTAGLYNFNSLATYPFTGGSSTAWSQKTFTFTASAATLNIAFRYLNAAAPQNGNFWNISFGSNAIALCNAGSTAPSLTGFTVPNVCPASSVNLNSLLSSSATAAQVSMLKWFTNSAHTGTAVADPTQAPAGTYYAFYYDATNNCYSPASVAVTATVAPCCPTVAPTIN